eukprot:TRINITY_DN23199_c0_g2_i1.p1 TRINITY_DN23199_c0_g2~~TRINITY_DN23199_c0_g2_i1.p1  ORF type:complete len:826 (-),score=117.26 TRINITY_DN23199_c0_g2_i1:310-2787(-)
MLSTPFARATSKHTKASWVVECAGQANVNGVYTRDDGLCDGADVFRKHGTSFALMRRKTEGWFVVDLGPSGRARWSLNVAELYCGVQQPAGLEPPAVGWIPMRGKKPGPSLRRCDKSEASEDLWNEITRDPRSTWRGLRTKGLMMRSHSSPNGLVATMKALKLPPLRGPPPLPAPGSVIDAYVCYRVTIWRPSAVTPWGFAWADESFKHNGARVISSVATGSPLERWNAWQQVRGRDDLCVAPGDWLLRTDGKFVFFDVESNLKDGDLAVQAVGMDDDDPAAKQGLRTDRTGGCLVMDFVRKVKRPARPRPPILTEAGKCIKISWEDSFPDDDTMEEGVGGWAVCIQDLSSKLWYVLDAVTGVARPLATGGEYPAYPLDVADVEVSTGLYPDGRHYAACIALCTSHGWSAFSELSEPAALRQRGGIPVEEEYEIECLNFCVPQIVKPGSTAPVHLTAGARSFNESLRTLRFRTLLRGSCRELELVASRGSNRLVCQTLAHGEVIGKRKLRLHGIDLDMRLHVGDHVVGLNGIVGLENLATEFERGPNACALKVERPFGASLDVDAKPKPFDINVDLDEQASWLVEEVLMNELMDRPEGNLAGHMLGNDIASLEKSLHSAAGAALSSVPSRYEGLMKEAFDRLGFLRRRDGVQDDPDGAIFGLRLALCDIDCDPEMMENSIEQFLQLSPPVVASKFGQALLQRARGLQRLWAWRRDCEKCRRNLARFLEDGVERLLTGKAPGEEGEAAPDAEDDGSKEEFVLRDGLARLREALEQMRKYVRAASFDVSEAEFVVKRLEEAIEDNLSRRKKLAAISDDEEYSDDDDM